MFSDHYNCLAQPLAFDIKAYSKVTAHMGGKHCNITRRSPEMNFNSSNEGDKKKGKVYREALMTDVHEKTRNYLPYRE